MTIKKNKSNYGNDIWWITKKLLKTVYWLGIYACCIAYLGFSRERRRGRKRKQFRIVVLEEGNQKEKKEVC